MVELHGGQLTVRSTLNKGTTFTVELTMKAGNPDVDAVEVQRSTFGDTLHAVESFASLRCLVVDDTASNRRMMVMMLNRLGVQTSECDDGIECVRQYSEQMSGVGGPKVVPYDIIFMDSMMPIMQGNDASLALRVLGYDNMIIGVTGNALEEDKRAFVESGADVVLAKPTSKGVITNLLHYVNKFGAKRHPNIQINCVNDQFIRIGV